jgi:molecular chaperone GrpE (heat shock protein)
MFIVKSLFRQSRQFRHFRRCFQSSVRPGALYVPRTFQYRYFSEKVNETKKAEKEEKEPEEPKEKQPKEKEETQDDKTDEPETTETESEDEELHLTPEDVKRIKQLVIDQDSEIEELKEQNENLLKKYQYQLASNDNTVKRYKKEVEKAKEFSISKFAKDLLEVRDNLQRAVDHAEKSEEGQNMWRG